MDRDRFRPIRVLLIERSEDNRYLVNAVLQHTNIDLEEAHDGAEGVQKALSNSYDIVLMDMHMPVVDGYLVASKLREKGFAKPIVALTDLLNLNEEQKRVFDSGCDACLAKPLDLDLLLKTIRSLVGYWH